MWFLTSDRIVPSSAGSGSLRPTASWTLQLKHNSPLQLQELLAQWHSITSKRACTFSASTVRTSDLAVVRLYNVSVICCFRTEWYFTDRLWSIYVSFRSCDSCRRLPEPKHHSFLFSHWSSSKCLVFMDARTPSIHVFLGHPLFLPSPGIHSIINFGSLSSCILLTWPYHWSLFLSMMSTMSSFSFNPIISDSGYLVIFKALSSWLNVSELHCRTWSLHGDWKLQNTARQ